MTSVGQTDRRRGAGRVWEELGRHDKRGAKRFTEIAREGGKTGGIEAGELGRLYEASLAREKSQQRATGSFYTPEYLVDFVVERTLAPLVAERSVAAVCKLRILDPSCGGGAFLLGVLRFLEAHCVAMGARSGPALRRRLCKCLVGVDLDSVAIEVSRASLQLAVGGRASMPTLTLQVGDALLPETDVGPIDAIVGNPPWGQKGLRLDAKSRARYRELFVTAVGVWDPFKLFVERCHQILGDGARWGLVLPDIVLLKNLQCVRDVILDNSAISDIAHCGQAFAGVNIDAVAMVATRTKRKAGKAHQLRVWPHLPADWQQSLPPHHSQEQSVFRELPGHRFNLYLHGHALNLYRRLQELPRIGSRWEMHEGVHSGNARAKLFIDRKRHRDCHKLILGRGELAAYQLHWQGGWIDCAPMALDKSAGDYANLGRAHWHRSKKIVVRRTGDRVIAACDGAGYYVSNNMFVLLAKGEHSEVESKALVALLNSRFMTWYFRAVQPRVGRLFAELKLIHLRDFPMPDPVAWQALAAKLAALCDLASKEGAASVAARVDALVESAFEISPRERELIKLAQ